MCLVLCVSHRRKGYEETLRKIFQAISFLNMVGIGLHVVQNRQAIIKFVYVTDQVDNINNFTYTYKCQPQTLVVQIIHTQLYDYSYVNEKKKYMNFIMFA